MYYKRHVDQMIKSGDFYSEIGVEKVLNKFPTYKELNLELPSKELDESSNNTIPSLESSTVNEIIGDKFTKNSLLNAESTTSKDCSSTDTIFNQNCNVNNRPKRNIVKPIRFKDFV